MVSQGFMSRTLNFGDLVFSTPDQYAGSVVMLGVSDLMCLVTAGLLLRRIARRYLSWR